MATVTISATMFQVYVDVATADAYMLAAVQGAPYRASDADTKARSLVTSTRMLDRQNWLGKKFDPNQELAFPRKNMGIAGLDDSAGVTPQGIIDGSIELANYLIDGSDVQDEQSTAERISSLAAGSVSISFFRGVDSFLGMGGSNRFPLIVQELVGMYLQGGDSAFGIAKARGTHARSKFPGHYGYSDGI